MIRQPLLVANWKLNHGPSAARTFVERFSARYARRDDRTVVLCPPVISLEATAEALKGREDIGLGVQNVWTEPKGAFTGETSAAMAADIGARYCLVGHSERRHVFGESRQETGLKCAAAHRAGLIPVLCVGELLAEREAGTTEQVVIDQLQAGIEHLPDAAVESMVVAYEPVWAIGTGRTATPTDATAVHRRLRQELMSRVGREAALGVPILYGGSVNEGNAASLLAADQVGGLLVGGASLDPEGWASICTT